MGYFNHSFPNLVVTNSEESQHTSLSAASACTAKYIREYFQDGRLPEPGTTCEPDYFPFQDRGDDEDGSKLDMLDWGFGPLW